MNIKKILSYLVVAAIMMSAATLVSSCVKDGDKGDKGDKGEQGDKGDKGEQGEQGEQGKEGNTFVVTFVYDNGEPNVTQTVISGGWAMERGSYSGKIIVPETAGLYRASSGGYLLYEKGGWLHNGALFDFRTPITADITLTADWQIYGTITRIDEVSANDLGAAVDYAKANLGYYTLAIDANVNAVAQTFDVAGVHLYIVGIGGERTIQYNGANDAPLFLINANSSITLYQNITLRGITSSTTNLVRVGNASYSSLYMNPGSKITGHTTTSQYGAVYVTGADSRLEMRGGGEITGNHSSAASSSGGVYNDNGSLFYMTGGSITGNTGGTPAAAMDVVLNGTDVIARSSRTTSSVIGASTPATFAGN